MAGAGDGDADGVDTALALSISPPHPLTPATSTSIPIPTPSTASPADPSTDPRLRADFSNWHSGPRLTNEGILATYAGLFETPLQSGKYYSTHVIECVLRPDVELKRLMGVLLRCAAQHHLHLLYVQRSHALISHATLTSRPRGWAEPRASTSDSHEAPGAAFDQAREWQKEWACLDVQVRLSMLNFSMPIKDRIYRNDKSQPNHNQIVTNLPCS